MLSSTAVLLALASSLTQLSDNGEQLLHANLDRDNDGCLSIFELGRLNRTAFQSGQLFEPTTYDKTTTSPDHGFFTALLLLPVVGLSSFIVCESWETFGAPLLVFSAGQALLYCGVPGAHCILNL
jgi:hypothetical protein